MHQREFPPSTGPGFSDTDFFFLSFFPGNSYLLLLGCQQSCHRLDFAGPPNANHLETQAAGQTETWVGICFRDGWFVSVFQLDAYVPQTYWYSIQGHWRQHHPSPHSGEGNQQGGSM